MTKTLDAQQAALAAAGAEKVFAEKVSGAVTDRKALARAIGELGPGDVLLVTRLDRLARSTKDLLNTLDAIAKAGAGFRSLADAWADTTTPHGKLMITILGGLAEFERSLILARTSEGRIRAKARGVACGARPCDAGRAGGRDDCDMDRCNWSRPSDTNVRRFLPRAATDRAPHSSFRA
jgi:DNA invertase Pin-like site-specific DNA recombinase